MEKRGRKCEKEMVSVENLTESKSPGRWVSGHAWGDCLVLIKTRKSAHCGCLHSLTGSLDCVSREKELKSGMGSLSVFWVQMQCGQLALCSYITPSQPAAVSTPAMMDWIPREP